MLGIPLIRQMPTGRPTATCQRPGFPMSPRPLPRPRSQGRKRPGPRLPGVRAVPGRLPRQTACCLQTRAGRPALSSCPQPCHRFQSMDVHTHMALPGFRHLFLGRSAQLLPVNTTSDQASSRNCLVSVPVSSKTLNNFLEGGGQRRCKCPESPSEASL